MSFCGTRYIEKEGHVSPENEILVLQFRENEGVQYIEESQR